MYSNIKVRVGFFLFYYDYKVISHSSVICNLNIYIKQKSYIVKKLSVKFSHTTIIVYF